MTTNINCPKCGGNFSSVDSYQNHLPCGSSTTLGGSGDVYKGSRQETAKEGGTGER